MSSEPLSNPATRSSWKYVGAALVALFVTGVAVAGYRHWVALPPLTFVGDRNAGPRRAWEPASFRVAIRNRSWWPVVLERVDNY